MKEIDCEEVIGKSVKDLEQFELRESNQFFSQKKHLLLSLSIMALFAFLTGTIWSLKHEMHLLQSKVLQLNEENATFREQINTQINQQPVDEFIYHEIQEGECFEIISKRYYGTENYAPELALLNNMTIDTVLKVGQVIKIPKEIEMLKQYIYK